MSTQSKSVDGLTYETWREMIEVTRGPTINHPGDVMREFIPGPWEGRISLVGHDGRFVTVELQHSAVVELHADPTRKTALRLLTQAHPSHVYVHPPSCQVPDCGCDGTPHP